MTTYRAWACRVLARAALADAGAGGGTHVDAVIARWAATLGSRPSWLGELAAAVVRTAAFATADEAALAALIDGAAPHELPRIRRLILRPPRMRPPPLGLDAIELPPLPTVGDLAHWLGLEPGRLQWLVNPALSWRHRADLPHPPAQHYRTRHRPKAGGGVRLIEAPLPDMRQAQRRLLDGLLSRVPVHEACHGFVAGRSVLTHAQGHVGQDIVVRLDLRDFFPSVRASAVHALWRTLGYPVGVARALTSLTTVRTPRNVLAPLREAGRIDWLAARRLAAPHLPQGAPTSPALANLATFNLDLRLDGLAWTFGAHYTRYADDLVFSGPLSLQRRLGSLLGWATAIAADEGFAVHRGKTRAMPRHRAQCVGGVMVNEHPNLPRAAYDRLRAVLHGCVRDGPLAHNREQHPDFRAHLLGRIGWARQLNPARALKLQALFDQIRWPN